MTCITLVLGKVILGIALRIAAHELIPLDFRHNGSRRDRRAFSVALHDIDLTRIEMQRITVEEYDIGMHARLLDCLNSA